MTRAGGGARVLLKGIGQPMVELAKFVGRCLADPRGAGRRWEWTTIKLGISVWIRQFFTTFIAYQDASAPAHRRQL